MHLLITDTETYLVGLTLSLMGLRIFVFFVSYFLIHTKKDELEENNVRIHQHVLDYVRSFCHIVDLKSSIAQELPATNILLLENSSELPFRADE